MATRTPAVAPFATEGSSDQVKMENEYLLSQLLPGNHYSVNREPAAEENGQIDPDEDDPQFRLLNASTAKSREHLVQTVESKYEIEAIAPVALQIQREKVLQGPQSAPQVGEGIIRVVSEPEWVRPTDIAPFDIFSKHLHIWQQAIPSQEHEGGMVLSRQQQAICRYGVLDDKCPVLAIIAHLKSRGGTLSKGRLFTGMSTADLSMQP